MKQENTDDGWQAFLELCTKIKTPEEFNQLLSLFLTFEERETMGSRYLIIRELLKQHLTQREIAQTYKVSIAQITRGSNALKIINPDFKAKLEKKINA